MATFTSRSGNTTFTGTSTTWDLVDYRGDYAAGGTAGVNVNLATGVAKDGWGATDTLVSIESVFGTRSKDVFRGSIYDNQFVGGGGADTIIGGGGYDTIDYAAEQTYTGGSLGVRVNFATGRATDTFGAIDTLSGLFAVRGTSLKDVFTGSARTYRDSTNAVQDYEQFEGNRGADTIDGGNGFDAVSHLYDPAGIVADLTTGTIKDGWGDIDRVFNIERVIGSAHKDVITGGENHYTDAWGNRSEFMSYRGMEGADTINGGAGIDEVMYDRDPKAVRVDLAQGRATDGWDDVDILRGIERVRGSNYDDTLLGSGGDNAFRGMAGHDVIDGRQGTDEVIYTGDASGVVVDLTQGKARDGWGYLDTLAGIENVRGSMFHDTLVGNSGDNRLSGMAGADTITGGAGNDMVCYASDAYMGGMRGVMVNLTTNRGRDGWGGSDILSGIEQACGTRAADTLTGGAGENLLLGQDGNDILSGAGGRDTLVGGAGADRFVYETAAEGNDILSDFSVQQRDRLEFRSRGFGGLARGQLAATRFESLASSSRATRATTRFILNRQEKALYYDADGTGAGAAVRIATFTGGALPSYRDIFIV